jgi:fumarylacetoacetase
MPSLDTTHDARLSSWVESANDTGSDFPLQNLPFGVFRSRSGGAPRVGVALGDQIVDVAACARAGLLQGDGREVAHLCDSPRLNPLLARGRAGARALRTSLVDLLRADAPGELQRAARQAKVLLPSVSVEMQLPFDVGDYTDFYASVFHATNVGSMFRPDSPLLPNYKWVPIGYHGRASSIVASGSEVRRPRGQVRDDPSAPPVLVPTRRLDYELEVGVVIGRENALGTSVPIEHAHEHVFGLCLVNDWSARDVQTWEYQPLGPFLAKNFATTISPWVVTLDALEPFRAPAFARDPGDPTPLPYLASASDEREGAFDVTLEVFVRSTAMRASGAAPMLVSRGSFATMYWTVAQLVAHHTVNGCNLRPGDLLASGTVSGAAKESRGCLLERTWRGTEPLELPTGERRSFLEDGDEVIMRGFCERDGFRRIGFGECIGTVIPSR